MLNTESQRLSHKWYLHLINALEISDTPTYILHDLVTIAWDLNDLKCRNTRCHRCHGVLDCIEEDVAGSRRLGSWKLTPCKLPQNKIFYEEIFYLALWNPHNVSSVLPTFRFMGFESPSPMTSTFAPLNVYVTSFRFIYNFNSWKLKIVIESELLSLIYQAKIKKEDLIIIHFFIEF